MPFFADTIDGDANAIEEIFHKAPGQKIRALRIEFYGAVAGDYAMVGPHTGCRAHGWLLSSNQYYDGLGTLTWESFTLSFSADELKALDNEDVTLFCDFVCAGAIKVIGIEER